MEQKSNSRRTDFNYFLNGFGNKKKILISIFAFTIFWQRRHHAAAEMRKRLLPFLLQLHITATDLSSGTKFLSWIFTSACIKWWHFYNQTRLATTTRHKIFSAILHIFWRENFSNSQRLVSHGAIIAFHSMTATSSKQEKKEAKQTEIQRFFSLWFFSLFF